MRTFFVALLSIVLSVAAQFSLRAGMSSPTVRSVVAQRSDLLSVFLAAFSDVRVLVGFLLYGVGAAVWLAVLSNWEVSKAYPLVGLGFVLTLIVGHFVGEEVDGLRIAGALLICAGVVLVSRS